jgi:hypothetical protein
LELQNNEGAIQNMLYLGSLIVLSSILFLVDRFRSGRWPKIDGLIVDAKLHEMYTAGDRIFWPEVSYEYVVSGNKYISSTKVMRISLIDDFSRGGWQKKYATGSSVTVAYRKTKPSVSTIEYGISVYEIVPLVIGLCVLGLSTLGMKI